MDTNFSGWGYPLSQTLTLSSGLPGIVVDVNSTSGSTTAVFAGIQGKLPLFSFVLPIDDDDDTGAESSDVGLRQYIGGMSVIVE